MGYHKKILLHLFSYLFCLFVYLRRLFVSERTFLKVIQLKLLYCPWFAFVFNSFLSLIYLCSSPPREKTLYMRLAVKIQHWWRVLTANRDLLPFESYGQFPVFENFTSGLIKVNVSVIQLSEKMPKNCQKAVANDGNYI